jgi:hypothetical protein
MEARDEEDHGKRSQQRYDESPRIRVRQRAEDVLRDGEPAILWFVSLLPLDTPDSIGILR